MILGASPGSLSDVFNQCLLMLVLWSCGRRRSVVQAQRQIHRAFAGSYAATYALRHTRHADPALALPKKIGATSVSSLSLGVAQFSCLWLALASLALFEPIAVAVHFEDVDVVSQSIEQRTGQPLGADDFMMPLSSKELCVVLVFSTQRSGCSKG